MRDRMRGSGGYPNRYLRRQLGIFLAFGLLFGGGSAVRGKESHPLGLQFQLRADQEGDLPPEERLWPAGSFPPAEVARPGVSENRGGEKLNRWVSGIVTPTITSYRAPQERNLGTAIVICPGGGYSGLAYDKEGHDVARWLNELGITGIVLKYRVVDYGHPAPWEDATRAIATVRRRAESLGVKPDRIGILGFSAGGHVASSASTRWRDVEIDSVKISSRPDFSILIYPVISMDASITHAGSRRNLLGRYLKGEGNSAKQARELIDLYSNEFQVTQETPPAFLAHSLDDRAVPLENSLAYFRALQKNNVAAELALYEEGGHGFGLGLSPGAHCQWPNRCQVWLASQGLLER